MSMTYSATQPQPLSLCRLPEVIRRVGLSRASIYAKMASGQFPAAIRLGPRLVAWPSHAIDQYIQTQIDATRTGAYAPRIVGKRRPK